MPKYKVTSGGFEIILQEETFENAAHLAIQIHDESNSIVELNEITMMENLDTSEVAYIGTQFLIESHTAGFGADRGQYMRKDECLNIKKFKKDD